MDNKSLSHTKWKCQYKQVKIVEGAVCIDHVHICVSIPPKMSVSNFMGYLKGKSTLMLYDRHPELQNKWDKAFWVRGYYVATIGNVTESTIKIHKRAIRRSKKRRWYNSRFLAVTSKKGLQHHLLR